MDELQQLKYLLDDLLDRTRKRGATKICEVVIRMGVFEEIDPESIVDYFKRHAAGTAAEDAKLIIERSSKLQELELISFDCV